MCRFWVLFVCGPFTSTHANRVFTRTALHTSGLLTDPRRTKTKLFSRARRVVFGGAQLIRPFDRPPTNNDGAKDHIFQVIAYRHSSQLVVFGVSCSSLFFISTRLTLQAKESLQFRFASTNNKLTNGRVCRNPLILVGELLLFVLLPKTTNHRPF